MCKFEGLAGYAWAFGFFGLWGGLIVLHSGCLSVFLIYELKEMMVGRSSVAAAFPGCGKV